MLRIDRLSHRYGDGPDVLQDIELTVPDGQLLTLVGPSGCGKSTLLRCVAGLLRPSAGRITLDGEVVDGVPDRLGVVFQDYSRSLFPWLTVRENVALPLRRRGLPRAERHAAAVAWDMAATTFAGRVVVAEEGMRLSVGNREEIHQ
ncbi:ATP-binding cassette domain-containing protein, partial [Streptomyces asiaticus]